MELNKHRELLDNKKNWAEFDIYMKLFERGVIN